MTKIALSQMSSNSEHTLSPRAVVVMGVSGSGKSTVAHALSETLGWHFVEGDAFHSAQSQEKMKAGVPLTDEDRAAWLDVLAHELALHCDTGVVLSCSALKQRYRQHLRNHVHGLRFIWLDVGRATAAQRVSGRGQAHFFPAALIDSQFQALEPPHNELDLLHIDGEAPLVTIMSSAQRWLGDSEFAS